MADEVRDPFAAAEMGGLKSELHGLRTDLLGVGKTTKDAVAGIGELKKQARREAAAVTTPAAVTRNIEEAAATVRNPAARLQKVVGGGRLADAIRTVQEAVDPILLAARSLPQRAGGHAPTPTAVGSAAESVRQAVQPEAIGRAIARSVAKDFRVTADRSPYPAADPGRERFARSPGAEVLLRRRSAPAIGELPGAAGAGDERVAAERKEQAERTAAVQAGAKERAAAERRATVPLSESPVFTQAGAGGGGDRPPLKTVLPGFDPGDEGPRYNLNTADAEAYTRAIGGAGRSTKNFEGELQRLTREAGLGGDQMRRHGLLTTEFLEAAAHGRTTVRELGVQMGGTIAKFGGWTAAAALTYGGLTAVQALGKGATQSLQGVTDLQRVVDNLDTGKAQGDFRALAREFNLPVDQVTAAAFEASKAFKDQNSIMDATRASLFGVKIGELDAATSAKFTTAIYRGFKLEAKDLGSVIDVVNQLQNRFGANFAQTAQGVAAAAGAFGAAGGKYQELAAFIATGSLSTGKTGNEIGTALRRTAEITGRPERRQTIIDVLGIDPQDSSITQILERAQELVKRGADPARIARAITTPELASGRIIPILRSQELYKAALAETRRSEGSAERERAVALRSFNEEVKQVGVNLQRLGSSLAQSGVLDAAGGLLKLLNLTLNVTNALTEKFAGLPGPLRQGLSIATQLFAAGAVARRFNVGGSFQEGSFLNRALARNPQRLERAEILQGLSYERRFVTDARKQAGQHAANLFFDVGEQSKRRDKLVKLAESEEGTALDAQRAIAAQRKLERLQGELADAEETSANLKARQLALVDNERGFARATTRRGGADPLEEAERRGIFYSAPLTTAPTTEGPFQINDPHRSESGLLVPGSAVRSQEAAKAGETVVRRETDSARAGVRAGIDRAASRAKTGLVRSSANLARSLASSLGPLEIGLLGVIGVVEGYSALKASQKKQEKEAERIRKLPFTEPNLDDAVRKAEEEKKALGKRSNIASLLGLPQKLHVGDTEQAAAIDFAIKVAKGAQSKAGADPLDRNQIRAKLNEQLRTGDPDAFKNAFEEVKKARGLVLAQFAYSVAKASGDKPRTEKARVALERAKEDVRVFREELDNRRDTMKAVLGEYDKGLTISDLQAANTVRLYFHGPTRKAVAGSAKVLKERLRDVLVSDDAASQAEAIAGIQAAQQQVVQALDAKLQRDLVGATPKQSRRLQQNYIADRRRLEQKPIEDLIKRQKESTEGIEKAISAEQASITSAPAAGPERSYFLTHRRQELKTLRDSFKAAGGKMKDLRDLLDITRETIDAIQREQRVTRFDERTDAFDARTERLQSEESSDAGKALILQQRGREKVARFRRGVARGVKKQADLDRVIAEYNNSLDQAESDAMAQFDADQGLASAQYAGSHRSEESRLRFAIGQANQRLSKLRSTGAKKVDITTQQRAIQESQNALAEYLRSQAEDLVHANAELALSKTTDPVQQARIRYREALRIRQYADTPAEKIRANANVRTTRRDVANARVNQAADDIQFDLDMEKIEASTAARRLRALAKGVKNNKELKRDLLRRAKALEDSDDEREFELTPGNVRLPTLAEIRKFRGDVLGGDGRGDGGNDAAKKPAAKAASDDGRDAKKPAAKAASVDGRDERLEQAREDLRRARAEVDALRKPHGEEDASKKLSQAVAALRRARVGSSEYDRALAEIRKYRTEHGGRGAGSRTSIDLRRNTMIHNRNTIVLHVKAGDEGKFLDALEKALGDVKVRARAKRPG